MKSFKTTTGEEKMDKKIGVLGSIQDYIDNAIELWEKGFTSKASKKRCLEKLNYAYPYLARNIRSIYAETPQEKRNDEWHRLYWMVPNDLFQWKEKHNQAHNADNLVHIVKKIDSMAKLRMAIKETEITPPMKSEEKIVKDYVLKSIEEIMEAKRVQFLEGYELTELFGNARVNVSSHYVTNQHGTTFVRNFFYLHGKLTSLNMILAIVGKHKEEYPELYKERVA